MRPVIAEHIEATTGVCGGKPRIAGHRIRVQDIVIEHEAWGLSPDEIVDGHPGITLADVHAALAYYHDHRDEMRMAIADDRAKAEAFRNENPSKILHVGTTRTASIFALCALVSFVPTYGGAADKDAAPKNRWEAAIREFEAADREKAPPTSAVLFVGSSSIRGWKTLAKDFAPLTVINRGFGGSQLADAHHFADRIIIPYRPKAVVIYAGDNDIAAGKTPETVLADFKRLAGKIRRDLPKCRVYFIAIKPSIARWKLWPKMKAANAKVAAYIKDNKWAGYFDISKPLLDENNKPRPDLFATDGLHLSAKGYAAWTKVIKPVLMRDVRRKPSQSKD